MLSSCTGVEARLEKTDGLIREAGFRSEIFRTSTYPLFLAFKDDRDVGAGPLTVVIEGDGYAWVNRYTLSDDPTPRDPVGLRIAAALEPSAIYLGRPCQYVSSALCDPSVWSSQRFGAPVLQAYMEVLDALSARAGGVGRSFHLAGFSGGAYLALMLAAQRDDVARVTSIAGLMDPDAWSTYQDISPLEVLYPPEVLLKNSADVAFVHFCSRDDDVLPCVLADGFVRRAGHMGLRNHRVIRFSGASHQSLWREALGAGFQDVLFSGSTQPILPSAR